MTSVTMRYVFKLRFVLLGLKTVFIGYYELISCATDGSNSFVGAYVWFIVWLIRALKGSLARMTRKRPTIYKPPVSLEDWRVNVSRSVKLFAFSAHGHTLCLSSNLVTCACAAVTRISRNAFKETFRAIESISVGLPSTYWFVYKWVSDSFAYSASQQCSFLRFTYPQLKTRPFGTKWQNSPLSKG